MPLEESFGIFDAVIDPSMPFTQSFISINSNGGSIGNIKWVNSTRYSQGSFTLTKSWKTIQKLSEEHLRNFKTPWLKGITEVSDLISNLVNGKHSYGTAVYAMSIAAEAAFNYIASEQGVTGFMASCADLDFIRRTRLIKSNFSLVTVDNYLYPQYEYKHEELRINMEKAAAKIALDNLKEEKDLKAHPNVAAYWYNLVANYLPEEYEEIVEQRQQKPQLV